MEKIATDIQTVRSLVVDKALIFFAFASPFALALSLSRSFEHGWRPLYFLHIGVVAFVIIVAVFRKQFSFRTRALTLLGLIFLVGASALPAFGLLTEGFITLFSFAVLTAAIFGTRAGLIACGVDLVAMIITGIAVCTGAITFSFDIDRYATSVTAWAMVTILFFLFAPIAIFAFGVIYEHLVTSLRQQEKSEENYRLLVENIPSVAWIISERGKTTFFSPNVQKIYGFTQEEIYEGGDAIWLERIHPEDVDRVRDSFGAMFSREKKFDVEYRIKRKDDIWIWIHNSGRMAFEKNGIRYAYGVFSDITDRKKAEEALIESETKHRVLFDTANDAILLIEDRRFVDCNEKTLEMFGAARDQIIGKTPYHFAPAIQPDGRDSKQSAIEKIEAVLKGEPQFFEWGHCRLDGTPFYTDVSLTDMQVGERHYILAIVRDISQRKELEEEKRKTARQLQQAQKMEAIGTLAGGIAHDFNNILSSVLGFAELVKFDLPEQNPELTENIESVITAGLRAKELVRHILTFSRQAEADMAPIILSTLVKEVVKLLKASLPASIETRVSISAETGTVFGDTSQIQQIVMNLCVNAAHAMKPDGGVLALCIEKETVEERIPGYEEMEPGEYLRLTVSDTGHGIPEDILDRIFDPFFTTKTRSEGTGMGLSVVHGIVKEMKGAIRVESAPGKGTTFHVMLPVYKGTAESKSDAVRHEPKKGKGRILFVDDEAPIVDVAGRTLSRLGYDVKTVTESFEALNMFADDPEAFDLVVADIDMPRMNGLELSKRVREKRPDLPIILCTGSPQDIPPRALNDIGIYKMVTKPLLVTELAELVKSAMVLSQQEG